MQLTPYIMFNGNCEEAMNFYAGALGGEIKEFSRYEGSPAEGMSDDKSKVMHARMVAGDSSIMGADAQQPAQGNNVHLSLNFDSVEKGEKIFAALSEGATVTMPLQDTFWGARFGMLTDKFGINWMVN
jgi:PhnB protein